MAFLANLVKLVQDNLVLSILSFVLALFIVCKVLKIKFCLCKIFGRPRHKCCKKKMKCKKKVRFADRPVMELEAGTDDIDR